MLRLLIPLFLSAPAAGCGLLLDFDPPDPTAVATIDGGGPDAGMPADARIGMADASPGTDSGPIEAGVDAGPTDANIAPDASDGGPPEGCADDSVEQAYPSGDMVGCDGAATQCEAETLCAPGWHLCTFLEHATHGGDATPATAMRWLAACVRLDNCSATGGVSGALCGDCSVEIGPNRSFGGACAGGRRIETDACPAGVAAATDPVPTLFDSTPTCTHADVAGTDRLLGATCCR